MLFDENHFITSFKNCTDNYCSPALVNAVCAASCHLLLPGSDEQDRSAIFGLKQRFAEEARHLVKNAAPAKMTSVQTWAVMFLSEVGSGDGLIASSHLRLACEMLLAERNGKQSAESTEVASWGIFTLFT